MYRLSLSLLLFSAACRGTPTDPYEACDRGPSATWRENTVPASIADAFADELDDLGATGVTYAILVDGEIRYAGSAGLRDRANTLPMEPDTLVRSGSTLKMQTAALVMALEGEGTLDREDTVASWLPDLRPAAAPDVLERTTLRHLLTHQGGFSDYTPIDGPAGEQALYNQAHNVWAAEATMLTEPGNFYNYSNPNFALAGLVAEAAGGAPYADQMRERVWTPMCMLRTHLDAEPVLADGNWAASRAAFDATGEQRIEPGTYDHGFSRPAGFAWTSAPDMVRFASFLLDGDPDVMPDEQALAITDFQVDTEIYPNGVTGYGFGIEVLERYSGLEGWREGPLLKHGGDIPGYAADLYVHEPSGVAVAVLSNTDGAHFTSAAIHAIEELASPEATEPADDGLPNDPAVFTGTYTDPDNVGDLVFTVVDGRLTLTAPRLDEYGIDYDTRPTAITTNTYAMDIDGLGLTASFIADDTGTPRWVRTRFFVAERTD